MDFQVIVTLGPSNMKETVLKEIDAKTTKSNKTANAEKSKTKDASKKKAYGKNLSPLEKARLARAAGGSAKKGAKKKNPLPLLKAP